MKLETSEGEREAFKKFLFDQYGNNTNDKKYTLAGIGVAALRDIDALLAEVERLRAGAPQAAAPPTPPLPAEVEETASTLRWLSGDDSGKFTNGDKSVLLRAASLLSRWPGVWRPIESITPQHGMRALTFGRLHDDGGFDMGESPAIQMSTYDRDSGWSSAEWGGHKPTHIYLLPEPPHE